MLKLTYNGSNLTCQQSNAQNSPSEASTVRELRIPDVQAGFRKGRGTRDQIANICWIIEKGRKFQKNIYFCFIDYAKGFNCVDHNKLENSLRDGNTRPPYLPLEKSVCRSGSNSQNWTWNNRLAHLEMPLSDQSISDYTEHEHRLGAWLTQIWMNSTWVGNSSTCSPGDATML